jgi:tetratricopeptide (TPR) repeat protein
VIDFGIAKATEGRLTDKTLFTGFAQLIGTPAYMSPEQAGLGGLDIDTRSDTYSLGVVLYELLTGRPPFDIKELMKSGYEAVLRTIRETDPVKPSTRLKLEQAARLGGPTKSEIGNPKSAIDPDLDWIVMKCLEKDRARRYETANGLALDLERYLRDEPVLARPPSALYRWQKFAGKHRAGVSVAAGFLLFLTIATVVSTSMALWATRERTQARASDADARAVLKFFRERVLAAAQPEGRDGGLGYDITLRAAVEAAEPGIAAAFTNQPLVEASIRDALGDAYANLGDHPAANRQHQRAWELFRARLGPNDPNTLGAAHGVAVTLHEMGKPALAVPLFEEIWHRRQATHGTNSLEALRAMCSLGSACRAAGQIRRAVLLFETALPLLRTNAGPRAAETLGALNYLAMSYRDLGRRSETIRLFEEVLRARRENPRTAPGSLATSMNNLAKAYEESGRFTNAVPLVDEALTIAMSKLGPDHPTTLKLMNTRGLLTLKIRQTEEALSQLEQALDATRAKLGPDHPDTAGSMLYVALAFFATGKTNEAVELLQDVLRTRKKALGPDHPETLSSITDLGVAYRRTGSVTNALPLLEESRRRSLASYGADHPAAKRALDSLVIAYVAAGRLEDALKLFNERLVMPDGQPRPEESDATLAIAALAHGCKEAGRFKTAAEYFEQAARLRTTRLERHNLESAQWLTQAGDCCLRQGNALEAEPLLRRALLALEATQPGLSPTFHAQGLLGGALVGQKKFTEAEPLLLQAHAGLVQRGAARPSSSRLVLLNDVAGQLVRLYEEWGKPEKAAEWRRKLGDRASPAANILP